MKRDITVTDREGNATTYERATSWEMGLRDELLILADDEHLALWPAGQWRSVENRGAAPEARVVIDNWRLIKPGLNEGTP